MLELVLPVSVVLEFNSRFDKRSYLAESVEDVVSLIKADDIIFNHYLLIRSGC